MATAIAIGFGVSAAAAAEPKIPLPAPVPGDSFWFVTNGFVGDASAVLGVPETDMRVLSLSCTADRGDSVEILPELYAEAPEADAFMVFNVDGRGFRRAIRLVPDDATGAFQARLTINRLDPLLRALRRGEAVSYALDPPPPADEIFSVSLDGSADVIREMLATC